MRKLHYCCSNCGKQEITSAMVGIPHGMYSLGYRAVGSALYCPQCVETWKERNGEEFEEQIANPTTQFAKWWNNLLASQIGGKDSIRTYRENAIGDFVEVKQGGHAVKTSEKSQRIVAEVLTQFMFARTMDEVTEVWKRVFEQYGLCDNPFTHTPCSPGEYEKDRLEYEKQAMIEKYGHCDGLE